MMLSFAFSLLPLFAQGAGPSGPSRVVETAGPAGPRVRPDASKPMLVQRVYNLPALEEARLQRSRSKYLLPVLSIDQEMPEAFQEPYYVFNNDELQQLFYSHMYDEIEYEGRAMWTLDDSRLILRAPETLHAKVNATLEFLAALSASHIELTIDVVVSRGKALGSPQLAGLVPIAAANEWLLNGVSAGERSRHVIELASGDVRTLELTQQVSAVIDWDLEIAQGAVIHDPVSAMLSLGREFQVAASPTGDGLMVAMSIVQGELVDGPISKSNRQRALLGSEASHDFIDVHSNTQWLTARNRSACINTALRKDQALVLRFDMAAVDGTSYHEALVIRRTGGSLAMLSECPSPDGRLLTVIDSTAISPPRASIPPDGNWMFPGSQNLCGQQMRELTGMHSMIQFDTTTTALIAIEESRGLEDLQSIGPWIFATARDEQAEDDDPDRREVPSYAEVLNDFAAQFETANLTLELRRNGPQGDVLQSASCAIRSGEPSVVCAGVEQTYMHGYDVEVAQFSAGADPQTFVAFEGLLSELTLAALPGGALRLELRAHATSMASNDTFKYGGPILEHEEQPRFVKLALNESLRIAKGETERRFVLGNQFDGAGSNGLTLIVTVRR